MNEVILADPIPAMFTQMSGNRFHVLPLDPADTRINPDVVAIVTYAHPRIDGPLLDRYPAVRVISNHGVGVDHIDLSTARQRGIPVGNTPGCLDAATADMTMALLLAVARNIVIGDHFARGPEFTHFDPSILIGQEVTGSTLGIVGMGGVGAEVARRARGFDMKIVYHNRRRRTDVEGSLAATWCSFEDLLRQSDFVSLNCPLTPETHGLMGLDQFRLMKRSGILINMARGPVVRTDALYHALTEKIIAAAALDVTDPEPLPRDHPLLKLNNVVIAPHLGSASGRTRERMMEMTIRNLVAGIERTALPWQVS